MTHRRTFLAIVVLLVMCSTARAQEVPDTPIRLEVGGSPGGGSWFIGGDDNTEVDFNVYTFGGYLDYYFTQKVAVEGEYVFGVGIGQDILFRNGLIPGQQVPYTHSVTGNVMFFPRGTTGPRLPYYVTAGGGLLNLVSREVTVKLGYNPDLNASEGFTTANIGAGIKIPRRVSAPNWSFRIDYRLVFINSNSDAPAFFAKTKSRKAHRVQFGMQYAFRR
jgi:Outer membrane protein beta-barrel domain